MQHYFGNDMTFKLLQLLGFTLFWITGLFAIAQEKNFSDQIIGVRALDIDGNQHNLGIDNRKVKPVILVFMEVGCPISERYIPMLNRLYEQSKSLGVDFYGVLSHPSANWKEAQTFRDEFSIAFPILWDGNLDLALRLQPTVVPETFVINQQDNVIYFGRVNDQYEAPGKFNPKERSPDLKIAMEAVAAGKPLEFRTKKAVGCIFEAKGRGIDTPNYNRHIAPIIEGNCTSCHQVGEIGPFPLTNYQETSRRAQMIQYVTESRLMPIWKAEPGYGKFANEHYLSNYQIDLIRQWVAQGMEEGNPGDLLPRKKKEKPSWKMGEPDLIVTMEPYDLPAEGDDQYRVFVLDGVIPRGKILKGYEFKPGDNEVVHHSTVFVDYTGTLKKYDNSDPAPGYNAFEKGGTMEFGSAITIGNWAPGADVYTYPDGVGFYVESKADVAIENHYHLSGKATTDQSTVGLYFADASETSEYATGSIVGSQKLMIKSGTAEHTEVIWTYVSADIKLIDLGPHMHYIGKSVKIEIVEPDGSSKPLLHIPDWDLRWQSVYTLREPILIRKGSLIKGTFVYDNSDDNYANPYYPAQDMFWGWGSNDEMLEFYLTYVPIDINDYGKVLSSSFAAFEHFYAPEERVEVNETNVEEVYQEFRQVDLWSDKGQVLLISIVESGMSKSVMHLMQKDRSKFSKDLDFITNHAYLIISDALFQFDEQQLYVAANKASTLLGKALAKDPTHWNANMSMGQILITSGEERYEKQGVEILQQLIEYQETLSVESKFSKPYWELGKYFYTLNDVELAEKYLNRGLNRHAEDKDLQQTLSSEGRIQRKTLN